MSWSESLAKCRSWTGTCQRRNGPGRRTESYPRPTTSPIPRPGRSWAPEHGGRAGTRRTVDTRADVFALGSLLAAILTGKPAFLGTTARETIEKTAAAELTDVRTRLESSGADSELVAIARHCLAANALERPADARDVASEVAKYRAGVEARLQRAETERAEALVRVAEQRKRRRVVQMGAAIIAAVLVAGIVGTSIGLYSARQSANEERLAKIREGERADGEKLANEQTQKRLAQIERGVEQLGGLVRGLNPRWEEQNDPLLYDSAAYAKAVRTGGEKPWPIRRCAAANPGDTLWIWERAGRGGAPASAPRARSGWGQTIPIPSPRWTVCRVLPGGRPLRESTPCSMGSCCRGKEVSQPRQPHHAE